MGFTKEEFNKKMIEIVTLAERLKSKIAMSRLVINEHCLNLARQVDIETEMLIENHSHQKAKICRLSYK
jgi:hypothetical protein